jgi:uncharacterized membrane protein required for colicin V production
MLSDVLLRINWVDILIVTLFLKLVLTAAANGVPVELFKLGGALTGFFLSLHYFDILTDSWISTAGAKSGSALFDVFNFILINAACYGVFFALRLVFIRHKRKPEEVHIAEKAAAGLFGCARAVLVAGLMVFGIMLTRAEYFKDQALTSFLGPSMVSLVPPLYSTVWDAVWAKTALKGTLNELVYHVAGGK